MQVCKFRGKQVARITPCCDKPEAGQFLCSEFEVCTDYDLGFIYKKTGGKMAACEGCLSFVAAVSETEKAFSGLPWGQGESVSGPGSSLDATAAICDQLPAMLNRLGVWSLLDIPCGDFHWMRHALPDSVEYVGADIVRELVNSNRERFPGKRFEHLDLITDNLPQTDAVFVRDCLVHLPYRMIYDALRNVCASGSTWLIATHFPGRTNHDIPLASWRPLDLTAQPFNLPQPTHVINEGCTEGGGAYADKSLGVWKIDDIREAVARIDRGPLLTIGMPYYRDWPGLWATVESILLHHPEVVPDVEFVVVDNDPQGKPDSNSEADHSSKARRLMDQVGGKYLHFTEVQGTAAAKGKIFELATSPSVLVVDCHVMLPTGTLRKLLDWFGEHRDSKDLYQGPCVSLGGQAVIGDHFAPRWGSLMFGQWANDERAKLGEPFEIPMQGCGLFACNKAAWPGFHPLLRGFGPEEWHIHQRIRKQGGKCLCLPWLKWSHRFGNPSGPAYAGMSHEDRLRGHLITWLDTDGSAAFLESIRHHFVNESKMPQKRFDAVLARTREEFGDKSIRGLGDVVAGVLNATGIGPAVKAITGGGCGCAGRQQTLNRIGSFASPPQRNH